MSNISRLRLLANEISNEDVLDSDANKIEASVSSRDERSIPRTHPIPSEYHSEVATNNNIPSALTSHASGTPIAKTIGSSRNSSPQQNSTPLEFSTTPTVSSSGSTTTSVDTNMFLKLQRQRLKNERIRSSLEQEFQTYEALQKEEDALRLKISRSHEVIKNLKEQSDLLESSYVGLEKLYRTNAEKVKLVQEASREVQEQWRKESTQFNMYSSQLKKLRQQLPELANELAMVADANTGITNKLIERVSVMKHEDENHNLDPSDRVEVSIQTNCDMHSLMELDSIRKQLSNQRAMMKQVRETVELLRRCP